MAEYVNVMEQKRRMCNSYALCSMGCPLNDIDFCNKNSGEKTNADFPEVERRVMSWAAEHPEPVYPTWWSYLINKGIIEKGSTYTGAIDQLKTKSIPADIAQLRGLSRRRVYEGLERGVHICGYDYRCCFVHHLEITGIWLDLRLSLRRDSMRQKDRILRHLLDQGSITQWEAIRDYGIMRLGARIWDLKRDGHNITSERETGVNRYNEKTHYAKYYLRKGE